MTYGASLLRFKVEILHEAITDPFWAWIKEKGPLFVGTEKPRHEFHDDESLELDPLAEYLAVDSEPPHRCPTAQLLRLRESRAGQPIATFDVTDFHFGNYQIRLTAYERRSPKYARTSRQVEIVLTPDLSDEAARLLGSEEHPYHKREEETAKALSDFRRPTGTRSITTEVESESEPATS